MYKGGDLKAPELLDRLYQSVEDRSKWPTFLGQLAALFNANSASLRLVDLKKPTIHRSYVFGYKPNQDQLYQDHLVVHDPFREHLLRIGLRLTQSREAISDRELVQTEHYQRFFRLQDNFYAAGGHITYRSGSAWQIGVHRSHRAGPFDSKELNLLEYFVPHLRRAASLMDTLDYTYGLLDRCEGILDTLSSPIWLVDAKGNCDWMNLAAEKVITDKTNGLRLCNGKLSHTQSQSAQIVSRIQREALSPPPRSHHAIIDKHGRGLIASPLEKALPDTACTPGTLLILLDPLRAQHIDIEILQELYGLTPAESKLARALAMGDSLEQITNQFQISSHTARSHLKSILRKTGNNRQAELVSMLLLSTALSP